VVFVVGKSGKPLVPTKRYGRVRHLLKEGKAKIVCYEPFTVQLTYDTKEIVPIEMTLGILPGSSHASLAVETHDNGSDSRCEIVYAKEILMRKDISSQLNRRRNARRNRRSKKRYRQPRFDNRPKSVCSICGKNHTPKKWKKVSRKNGKGHKWVSDGREAVCRKCQHEHSGEKDKHDSDKVLTPTLRNKVETIMREVEKLVKIMPITRIRVEMAAFDTQKMADPDLQGRDYQHGTLFGYEVKEYLLLRYGHKCVYCRGKSGDPVLEIDHVVPVSRGGSNRVSNLVIACQTCNRKKGSMTAEEFGFPDIQKRSDRFKAFKYSALTQSYKWALWRELKRLYAGYNVALEATFGYRTKARRLELNLPKTRVIDAMVIAAGDRSFEFPLEYLVERRLKARLPYHRFSNENKKGVTCVKTPAARGVNGFRLYDRVSFSASDGRKVTGYITSLRSRGDFEISDLEGKRLADKNWKKLTLEQPAYRNRLIEKRTIVNTISAQ
jgi:5-methylcytosine-specific restriction endonuclease McrA